MAPCHGERRALSASFARTLSPPPGCGPGHWQLRPAEAIAGGVASHAFCRVCNKEQRRPRY